MQTTCGNSGGSQLWTMGYQDTKNGWDYWWIGNLRANQNLNIKGSSTQAGAALEIWPGTPWYFSMQFRTPAGALPH